MPGLRPVEGHREVRAHDRVRRVARGEVDGGRGVDREHGHPGGAGATDDLDGGPDRVAELAADAGAEQRVDDDARLVDPLAEDGDVARDGGMHLRDAGEPVQALPVERGVVGAWPLLRRDEHDDRREPPRGEAPRGHEPVAAVVAGTREDQHGPVLAAVAGREGVRGGRDRRPGVLHERLAGHARRLGLAVEARHRLGGDGAAGGGVGPAELELVERHRLEVGVVRRERNRLGGHDAEGTARDPRHAEMKGRGRAAYRTPQMPWRRRGGRLSTCTACTPPHDRSPAPPSR